MLKRTTGFTLVELLVVVGIIALLIAMLMPALTKARQAAISVQCLSNLRQCGIGFAMQANDNRGQVEGEREEHIWGAGPIYYPWAWFVAGRGNTVGMLDNHPSGTNTPPEFPRYISHAATRCPAIPTWRDFNAGAATAVGFSTDSFMSYGIYRASDGTFTGAAQYFPSNRNVWLNQGGPAPPSINAKTKHWGYTKSTLTFMMHRIPRKTDFIMLADTAQRSSRTPHAAHIFTTHTRTTGAGVQAATRELPYFVHGTRLNCLFADGHAAAMSVGDLKRTANSPNWAFDKNRQLFMFP